MAYPPLPKRELGPPPPLQTFPKKFEIFHPLARYKKKVLAATKNIYLWVGEGVYTMEIKDTD